MVKVDEIRIPFRIPFRGPPCFRGGACHLTGDDLHELHEFAAKLGLRPEWFQDGRIPHYDLTRGKRQQAIDAGAVFVPAKEQLLCFIREEKKA